MCTVCGCGHAKVGGRALGARPEPFGMRSEIHDYAHWLEDTPPSDAPRAAARAELRDRGAQEQGL